MVKQVKGGFKRDTSQVRYEPVQVGGIRQSTEGAMPAYIQLDTSLADGLKEAITSFNKAGQSYVKTVKEKAADQMKILRSQGLSIDDIKKGIDEGKYPILESMYAQQNKEMYFGIFSATDIGNKMRQRIEFIKNDSEETKDLDIAGLTIEKLKEDIFKEQQFTLEDKSPVFKGAFANTMIEYTDKVQEDISEAMGNAEAKAQFDTLTQVLHKSWNLGMPKEAIKDTSKITGTQGTTEKQIGTISSGTKIFIEMQQFVENDPRLSYNDMDEIIISFLESKAARIKNGFIKDPSGIQTGEIIRILKLEGKDKFQKKNIPSYLHNKRFAKRVDKILTSLYSSATTGNKLEMQLKVLRDPYGLRIANNTEYIKKDGTIGFLDINSKDWGEAYRIYSREIAGKAVEKFKSSPQFDHLLLLEAEGKITKDDIEKHIYSYAEAEYINTFNLLKGELPPEYQGYYSRDPILMFSTVSDLAEKGVDLDNRNPNEPIHTTKILNAANGVYRASIILGEHQLLHLIDGEAAKATATAIYRLSANTRWDKWKIMDTLSKSRAKDRLKFLFENTYDGNNVIGSLDAKDLSDAVDSGLYHWFTDFTNWVQNVVFSEAMPIGISEQGMHSNWLSVFHKKHIPTMVHNVQYVREQVGDLANLILKQGTGEITEEKALFLANKEIMSTHVLVGNSFLPVYKFGKGIQQQLEYRTNMLKLQLHKQHYEFRRKVWEKRQQKGFEDFGLQYFSIDELKDTPTLVDKHGNPVAKDTTIMFNFLNENMKTNWFWLSKGLGESRQKYMSSVEAHPFNTSIVETRPGSKIF